MSNVNFDDINVTNWDELKTKYTNICNISGMIIGKPVKSFKTKQGEQFYEIKLESLRASHTADVVPITFSVAQLKTVNKAIEDKLPLCLTGSIRTKFIEDGFNEDGTNHMKLIMSVFTRNMFIGCTENDDINSCHLEGNLGRIKPVRETPNGRIVTDFTMRVSARENSNKVYNIPCIAWGHLAEWLSAVESGTHVTVDGRLQSRVYTNKLGETRTINELSISELIVK